MIKTMLIKFLLKALIVIIALGCGIWYLSSSLGGASLSYTSVDAFMTQIGVENGDIATANGCFLCGYIQDLFAVLGRATEMFWNAIIHSLWILMVIGFGIFIIYHTLKFLRENATSKDVIDMTDKEPEMKFSKWFETVWKTGVRILMAAAFLGVMNWGGTGVLKTTTNIIVTPVMYIGSTLSMAATGVISGAHCELTEVATKDEDILNPVLKPFMCVMGNLNTVMLAGAGGGFALMNYAWMGLGGGAFTWVAGLLLVILFLVIGFDLVFQILNVLFKLIFIIIFMPMLIAASAFEKVWGLAKGLLDASIKMLITSSVSILKISLKITIIYAVVFFAADSYYPAPEDSFTTILPPLMGHIQSKPSSPEAESVMQVFSKCEKVALKDGKMDKNIFKACFNSERASVEAKYPGAFDFMDDGFGFLLFMIGIFFLYYWVVSPKIDDMLKDKDSKSVFDYGDWIKNFGKTAYNIPGQIYDKIKDKLG